MQLFHRNSYKMSVSCFGFTSRCGLVRPASKSCRFSHHPLRVPNAWHGNFAACGQRSGLLALNLANIFEKLLDQKTFWLPAARFRETTCVRFGKAGAHPQLAWESQLPLKPCLSLQPFDFEGNCDSSDSLLDFCCVSLCSFYLLRKRGLLAHTSAAFLKNCCTEKLFICLRLVSCNQLHIFLFSLLSLVFVKR